MLLFSTSIMLYGLIIIYLAATLYISASTKVIEHIILSFDKYLKLVIKDVLKQCMKFSTLIWTYSNNKLFCKTVLINFTYEYLPSSWKPSFVCIACFVKNMQIFSISVKALKLQFMLQYLIIAAFHDFIGFVLWYICLPSAFSWYFGTQSYNIRIFSCKI